MYNLLKCNYIDVISKYGHLITKSFRRNSMIYMEHAGGGLDTLPQADVFCFFTRSGEMTIMCVRIHKQDVSASTWWRLVLKYKFKKAKGNKCYVVDPTHIDVIFYKMWWWEWAERFF